jgi:signal transduction histidine kinase
VLSNAYKYSPDGGAVALELTRTAVEANSSRRIGIRISDHGIGMNAMQLARVCERFYRADTSGKIPGTGLGMSIVKEIIELHHGELALESQPGQGTAVTLWLPAMDIDGGLA